VRVRHPARKWDAGEDIVAELRNHVGKEIGPIAKPQIHDRR